MWYLIYLSTSSFMYTDSIFQGSNGNIASSGYTLAGIEQSLGKAYAAMLWYSMLKLLLQLKERYLILVFQPQ